MVAWAAEARFVKAGFVCVCVDPSALATAKEFRELYFAGAPESLVNGYIDSKDDFPNFDAQLGCQGFIIFNSKHEIVERSSSPPWLAGRNVAFQHLERQLSNLLGTGALMSDNPLGAPIGQLVRIKGIVSERDRSLNDLQGEVDGSEESGNYLVTVGGERKRVRPENLEDATTAPVGKKMRLAGVGDLWKKYDGQDGEVLGGTASGRLIVQVGENRLSLNARNLQEIAQDADEILHQLSKIGSVGHDGMDAQHQECIDALKGLSSSCTVQSLEKVRRLLKEHFDEEEKLLVENGFGGGGGPFSALSSHSKDHDQIIRLADDALAKLSDVCDETVPQALVAKLCKAFVDHATMYDSLYEGKLGK